MPSRLALRSASARRAAKARAAALAPQLVRGGPPWLGYTPDLNPEIVGLSAAADSLSLVPRDGVLKQDEGWSQVNSDFLPLGWDEGDVTGVPPALTGMYTPEPVIHIKNFFRQGLQEHQGMAITADEAGGSDGHLYVLDPTGGRWTEIPYDGGGPTGAISLDLSEAIDDAKGLPDSAVFAPIDKFIFTNNFDTVMQFPRVDPTTDYTDFTTASGIARFRAKSVAVFQERLMFFNTEEGGVGGFGSGTRRTQRVRWTQVASASLTGRGAGALELVEFQGDGVSIRPIGDRVACYLEDGVAFLDRTFISEAPFSVRVVDRERGLLGTHAVVDLGGGTHFGIFDDGWFFLDSAGRWQEAGLFSIGPTTHKKWSRTFYSQLRRDRAFTIAADFCPFNQCIRVAWPDNDSIDGFPNRVWVYDIRTDSVWPDDYASGGGAPLCWGGLRELEEAGLTWATAPGTWGTATGTWNDTGPRFTEFFRAHGNRGGFIYMHDEGLTTRDGVLPNFLYQTHLIPVGNARLYKTIDRVGLSFLAQLGGDSISLAGIGSNNQSQAGNVETGSSDLGVMANDPRFSYIGARLSDTHIGLAVSGAAPVAISAVELQFLTPHGHEFIREG